MPYEPGGRADKFGGKYEARWVVKNLLRVIKEEIDSIILEAIGEDEQGVDVIVINKDGSKEYHQCKGRNAEKEKWTITDLNRRNILQNSKVHLDKDSTYKFILVSAASCLTLHDMHQRALNSNESINDFYNYQIKGTSLLGPFEDYCRYMNLDISDCQNLYKAKDYLSRTDVYNFADDLNSKKNILEIIELYFIGDSEIIYTLLAEYVIEENLLGHTINNNMIVKYLKQKGILLRNLASDERIMPRINELNEEFLDSLNPINNKFIERKEVNDILNEIENGNSIVIHGKAGYGKSGCVYDVLKHLRDQNKGVLALKLDKRTPENSTKQYGQSLDLPASPIHCINEIYKNEKAVIILDQLDAIRWTGANSSTSIDVCKKMIKEVTNLNLDRKQKISMIFVCRTYDYENDKNIRALFKDNEENEYKWTNIKIDKLELLNVKEIIGDIYYNYTKRLKDLLRVPNNLYIWTQLEDDKKTDDIKSSNDLIKKWMEQLIEKFEMEGYERERIDSIISQMVKLMEEKGRLEISTRLFRNISEVAKKYLKSEGLINENNDKISFVHQSFFDYFLVEDMFKNVWDTENIIDIMGDKSKQTPMKRYQIQMLLQQIQDEDFDIFIKLGHQILDSDKIRFFMQYLYIEILGQADQINKELECLLDKYLDNEKYKNSFIDTVFKGHKIFIEYLIDNGTITKLLSGNLESIRFAVSLLETVKHEIQDKIVEVITPYILKNSDRDVILYRCMCDEVYLDSEDMFAIRMQLLRANIYLLDRYFNFKELFKNNLKRGLELLKEIILYSSKKSRTDIYKAIDNDLFYDIDKINYIDGNLIYEILFPLIPQETKIYSSNMYRWSNNYGVEKNAQRTCVYLLKRGMVDIIRKDIRKFLNILEKHKNNSALLINEILLESAVELPIEYSDYILSWIRSNKGIHLLNRTGENKDELYYAKKIINKFTTYCSEEEFIAFEDFIYNYHEKDEVERLKDRINTNHENNGYHVYCHYWGEIQYSLLPCMFNERLSNKSKDLICVLNRRFKNVYLRHQKNYGHGGWVESTISPNAHRFSSKTWINIITNKNIEKKYQGRGSKWIEVEGGFYESSIELFSSTFENIAKQNPDRFGELALNLPNNIDSCYVRSIINLIGENNSDLEKENIAPISIEKSELIIKKYEDYLTDKECAKTLCNSIRKRSKENWSINILNIISKLAIEHSNPDENEIVVWNDEDKTMQTFDMLWANAINNVRGCAANTIGNILWERKDLLDLFKPAVESLARDKNKSVRLASIDCLCPIYNIEKEMSERLTLEILKRDYRVAAYPNCRQLVCLMYKKHKEELNSIIEKMFLSHDKDVCNYGAFYVANFYIKYNELGHLIELDKLNKNQKKGIILMAIELFNKEEYKEKCKEILSLFLDEDTDNGDLYNRLFYDKKIDIVRDKDLIHKILKGKISRRVLNDFIECLDECRNGILEFSDIILDLCESVIENYKKESENYEYRLYGIESIISNLIMSLYEKTIGRNDINEKCLDMLDLMFESGVSSLRKQLSSIIKDY